MITATSNENVKYVALLNKKKQLRQEDRVFVVEGVRAFSEVPDERLVQTYVTEDALGDEKTRALLKGRSYTEVSDTVMKYMSDTVSSQGILAIVKMDETGVVFEKGTNYMLLDRLQDPGNLGTIVRLCEAAGFSGIIMSPDTVDIYNPKVVRATMGGILRVHFEYRDLILAITYMRKHRIPVYGAALSQSFDYAQTDFTGGCGIVIGNEANGICEPVLEACTGRVCIPMQGSVESLNASVAAAVLAFEVYRQNRMK